MDLNNFNEVLDFAIDREEEAVQFYTQAQEMAFVPAAKTMLAEFADDERKHKRMLQGVKAKKMDNFRIQDIPNLKISDYLVEIPFKPNMPLTDIVHLAAKREEKAYKLYLDLATKCTDTVLKNIFDLLATEELKHKNKFEIMYDDQVLSEN